MSGTAHANQRVTLTWKANTDTSVAGYKIYYGVASRTYTNAVPVGNVTNMTVNGLVDGTTYYFAATTYNSAGAESGFSNEATYRTTNAVSSTTTSTNVQPSLPPTLAGLNNLVINENAGLNIVNLSGISSGASYQVRPLTVTAVSSNPALIPNPSVNYTSPNPGGALSFTPVAYGHGTATINVTVNNGQSQTNIISRSFMVTVNAVNQPPTLNPLANLTLSVATKNSASQIVALTGISSGAPNENQTLKVTVSSSNPSLIPTPIVSYTSPNSTGTLTFKPMLGTFGTSVITVTVNDGGTSNNIVTQQFTVIIANPLSRAVMPRIMSPLADQVVVAGQTATFNVSASGTAPMQYQWKLNGYSLASATNALLTLPHITTRQAGVYSVSVINSAGSASSPTANLTVYPTAAATLASPAAANGQFGFNVTGVPGSRYVVEASSDLVNWTAVQTNTSPFPFTDPNASHFSQRYYRTLYLSQ